MRWGTLWKGIVVILVVFFVGTFVLYELDYKGTYKVSATGVLRSIAGSTPSVVPYVTDEPMEYIDTWDVLKHITPAVKEPSAYWGYDLYMLKATLEIGGETYVDQLYANMTVPEDSTVAAVSYEYEFEKVQPGSGTMTFELYEWQLYYEPYGALVQTVTLEVEVGP